METLYGAAAQSAEEYAQRTGSSLEFAQSVFGDYSKREQTVLDNASNAYKTAGMSANEYMDTVNGFAASLNASLGEYEWQSANYADMIVTDMSDNANKMGTDIESIKNAYSGFAKQNFTMLDNLKLGYGGTKEEMERLLRKAEELEGLEVNSLDANSFADVASAIHTVQEELGITGTTAKEASETISGSVATMKSAWENLIVGIADDNADFDGLVDNFVDSVSTVGENLLPRIETAITGVGELIEQLLPVIIAEIPQMINNILPDLLTAGTGLVQSLITGIQENMPLIVESTMMIVEQLLATLLGMLPQIIQLGMDLIVNLALGLAQALPELIPQVIDCILAIVDTLLNNIDMIIDAGMEFVVALWTGLAEALPQLVEKIPEIIIKLIEAIVNNLPKIIESGIKIIVSLAEGLIKAIPQLIKAIPQIIEALVKGFMELGQKFKDIGKNIVDGIWDGLKNAWSSLVNWVKEAAGGILNAAKDALGIHSPSTKFKWLGEMCVAGFDEGAGDLLNPDGFTKNINASLRTVSANTSMSSRLGTDSIADAVADALMSVFEATSSQAPVGEQVTQVYLYPGAAEFGAVVYGAQSDASRRGLIPRIV